MIMETTHRRGILGLLDKINFLIAKIAQPDLVSLALRIGVAIPFWRSGLKKWDGFFELSDITTFLFTDEFKLHIFGSQYAYPAPELMAYLSGIGEILLPILIVLGFFTRKAALGLLVMTAIIQLTVPTGWSLHITWAAMALGVMYFGGGRISLDRLLLKQH